MRPITVSFTTLKNIFDTMAEEIKALVYEIEGQNPEYDYEYGFYNSDETEQMLQDVEYLYDDWQSMLELLDDYTEEEVTACNIDPTWEPVCPVHYDWLGHLTW